ncbi:MAG: hypothetical protein MI892_15765 [Desulfobacterales bacterium]|nr:hypothetical protein [Desulfobacterales bacterium]
MVIICSFIIGTSSSWADLISFSGAENAPNIAEIHINEDHVKINLEVYVNDLGIFYHLLPDDFFEAKNLSAPPIEERLKQFSTEGLRVLTDKKESIIPRVAIAEPRTRIDRASPYAGRINPFTRQPIPGPPDDPRVLYVELVYPFEGRPKTLTLIPPIDPRTGRLGASIGFACFHSQAIISNFNYMSGPVIVNLNWQDPWYSNFDDKKLQGGMRSGVSSYIYIEPYEVRHEILVRVKDIENWMDLGLEGSQFIEAHENEKLKERVGQFFLENENLLVDGQRLRPILDRTAFVKYTMTGSRFLESPEQLSINSARIGIIITYLTKGIPNQVENKWELWSERIQKVPTNAIDPVGPFPSYVTPDDNIHRWENFLKNYKAPTVEKVSLSRQQSHFKISVASVGCLVFVLPVFWMGFKQRKKGRHSLIFFCMVPAMAGASILLLPYTTISMPRPGIAMPLMSEEEAGKVVHSLLKNIYRSFDFREEEDVYDKLAICVDGDILTDIYLKNRKSFEVKQAGGARAKVSQVDILETQIMPEQERLNKSLKLKAQWSAVGTVGHWGHIHTRKNVYEALITLQVSDGAWKMTELSLLEETRVDPYSVQNYKTN